MNMDMRRKKQLLEEYRNRQPEMGVFSYHCKKTGESFLGISKDLKADFNSTTFKLNSRTHPNKKLQELWNLYSSEGFELKVLETFKYKDRDDVKIDEKLEILREKCLLSDPMARRIWK